MPLPILPMRPALRSHPHKPHAATPRRPKARAAPDARHLISTWRGRSSPPVLRPAAARAPARPPPAAQNRRCSGRRRVAAPRV
eukprot:6461479-Prymnesium_polylepis.1